MLRLSLRSMARNEAIFLFDQIGEALGAAATADRTDASFDRLRTNGKMCADRLSTKR